MIEFCSSARRCVATSVLVLAGIAGAQKAAAEIDPKYYAVEVSANVQSSPAQVQLVWPGDGSATGYTVSRKSPNATAWTQIATLPGTAASYTDTGSVGGSFEYRLQKNTSAGYTGYGYILAGIQAPLLENRGKVVLVVDNSFSASLAPELARLQQDLAGDGWTVLRHDVARTDSVSSVKALIKADYDADSANVKSVFLFGHVPVPRSGNINPDGHPDHQGAWTADTYYADMNGTWTDSTVNNSGAARSENWNVPGDGKFDQDTIPSDLELEVGRVDLSNMTCFSNKTPSRSELDLLRQYLNKDHNFRHGLLPLPRRGLICDNFGEKGGESFAASGWRSFAPMFGADTTVKIAANTFFPTLVNDGYLWSYGTGGGSYYTCNGVGGADDFALNDIKTAFTMLFGSYFGDWDNESNFLRAALGSTSYTLTVSWTGRPHYFYHHMALGETIGHSVRLSQNNATGGLYEKQNYGTRYVNTGLLGDPTLRLHPVLPPMNLSGGISGSSLVLAWTGSPDSALQGYHVYRGASASGPFTRLTASAPLTATSFVDAAAPSNAVYMVRAVKLETSGSGTYYNASQGIFLTNGVNLGTSPTPAPSPSPSPTVPAAPSNLSGVATLATQIKLTWSDNATNETGYKVFQRSYSSGAYAQIATMPAGSTTYTATGLNAGASYWYQVCANNSVGDSSRSLAISVTTPTLPAAASNVSATALSTNQARISWMDNANNETYFQVQVKVGSTGSYVVLGNAAANATSFTYSNFKPGVQYFFKVRTGNDAGLAVASNETSLTMPTSNPASTAPSPQPTAPANSAIFVKTDSATVGNWKGVYGADGNWVDSAPPALPGYATVASTGASEWVWNYGVDDLSALTLPGSSATRVAACWYSPTSLTFDINLTDGQAHNLALYALDWDLAGRVEQIDVLDAQTGAVLNTQTVSGFGLGKYLVWTVKGGIRIRVTRTTGPNAVVSGLFLSPAGAS